MKRFAMAVGLLTAGSLLEVSAHASGILVARFGDEHGHATTDDPTAIYYNPAGLSLHPGKLRIYVNGVLAYRTIEYDRPRGAIDKVLGMGSSGSGTPEEAVGANAGQAKAANIIASPFIAVVSDLGIPHFAVGAAFFAPFGGSAAFDSNPQFKDSMKYPGAVDGVQRWAIIDGTIRSLYGSVAASYTVPSIRLSLGAAGNVVVNQISTLRARNLDGTDDLLTSSGAVKEGRSFLDVSGTTFSVGAGAILEPLKDKLWLGVSYQSQPGFGENTLTGTLQNQFGVSAASPASKVEVKQSMPDVFRWGARFRPMPRLELRVFGEYVRWSVFDKQCILDASNAKRACDVDATGAQGPNAAGILANLPRNWQNAYAARLGGSYWVTPAVELFLGVGYDSNAVPDSTMDTALFDMNKADFSLGGRFLVMNDKLALNAAYTQVVYFDRDVPVRGQGGVPAAPPSPSRGPDGAGTYKQAVGLINLSLEYRFF